MAKKVKKTKTRAQFEAWCNTELKKIQAILLIQDHELNPIQPSKSPDTSTADYNFPYKDIEVAYSESLYTFWKDGDKRSAWAVLLHEMLHAVTDPLYGVGYDRFASKSQIENEREQLTDHLTNVLIKLTYDRK